MIAYVQSYDTSPPAPAISRKLDKDDNAIVTTTNGNGLNYIYIMIVEPIDFNSSASFQFVDRQFVVDKISGIVSENIQTETIIIQPRQKLVFKEIPYEGIEYEETQTTTLNNFSNVMLTIYGNFGVLPNDSQIEKEEEDWEKNDTALNEEEEVQQNEQLFK